MQKRYIQEKNLPLIFDLSVDYFRERRKKGIFIENVHYIIPPTSSKTKKAILWCITEIENWMFDNKIKDPSIDEEVENLLKRR